VDRILGKPAGMGGMEFSKFTEADCRKSLRNSGRYCEKLAPGHRHTIRTIASSKEAGTWLASTAKRDRGHGSRAVSTFARAADSRSDAAFANWLVGKMPGSPKLPFADRIRPRPISCNGNPPCEGQSRIKAGERAYHEWGLYRWSCPAAEPMNLSNAYLMSKF